MHHAQNEQYIDKNYGGVFIIWDRMFGTHKVEDENEACIYGIRSTLNTFNPVWANLHVYVKIIKPSYLVCQELLRKHAQHFIYQVM